MDRRGRISRLYHAALERNAAERTDFLRDACGENDALRQEVESLLASADHAARFLGAPAEPADGARLHQGDHLGRYRIERSLGRGGMGVVFLAYDPRLQRRVALKVLDDEGVGGASGARLVREARNAAALNHPNICAIYEVGDADGTPFIAMEYVDGRPLSDQLAEGALPMEAVLQYGIQAADALAYAHGHGVIHRDFKAANAMVADEGPLPDGGRLKIVDFGLARRNDPTMEEATTSSSVAAAGVAAGTPYAMAPEQVRGAPTDARTDVWALGVLLFEMAAGAKPFTADSLPELFSSILWRGPAALPKGVPVELRAVIERCLEKAPERRYQHAHDVSAALAAIQSGLVSPWVAWRYHVRRRPWLTAAAACLGVVVALTGVNVGGVRDRLLGTRELPPIRLAVLPFENLTGDAEQEYLSDGLTEEMITQLGRLHPPRLSVIARTSSMRYKGTETPIDEIGRELGVDYVLEGSARREGNRIRVSAQLVEVSDQLQVWADSYERELASILAVQNEVARGVAESLALALFPEEETRLAAARQVDPAAYEAYLRGRFHWYQFTPEDFVLAREYFEEALRIDPDYALAYVGLADAISTPGHRGEVPAPDVFPEARALLAKALELDDRLSEAYDLEARMKFAYDWDWQGAEEGFQRAIELRPSHPDTHVVYAQVLRITGRTEAALEEVQRGLELDPYNAFFQQQFAWHLAAADRNEEAIARLEAVLAAQPSFPPAHELLSAILFTEERYEESLQHMMPLARGDTDLVGVVSRAYADGGYRTAMRRAAETLVARAEQRYVAPMAIASAYARAGEVVLALDWLERAIDVHDTQIVYARMRPDFADLWDLPRFRELMRRINLPS